MIVIFLFNVILVFMYIFIYYFKATDKKMSVLMKALVMFLCPVVGVMFFLISNIIFHCFMSARVDLHDVVFSKERKKVIVKANEDEEKNIVSLEEALQITDKYNLRKLVMNIIQKGDYQELLSSISLALNSEDSETSHYAASILQDVLNNFRFEVSKRYQACLEENDKQVQKCVELIQYMNQICCQDVFTNMEQWDMVEKMHLALEIAYKKDKSQITSNIYEMVSMRLLELKKYDLCQIWCDRALQQYPKTLSSYSCLLKLYFTKGDKERFFHTMDQLTMSDITLDKETLELIRIYK